MASKVTQHVLIVDIKSQSMALVYEYLDQTLADLIQIKSKRNSDDFARRRTMLAAATSSALSRATLQNVMRQLLEGLDYLHSNWVVHRYFLIKSLIRMCASFVHPALC